MNRHERRHWLGRMLPVTHFPAVDEKLSEAEAAIQGFPLRLKLTVRRSYAGGPVMVDAAEVEALDIREIAPPASRFVRPPGYRYQRPVIGMPGR